MKFTILTIVLFLLIACQKKEEKKEQLYPEIAQTPEQLGKEIFEGKGNCVACHQVSQKVIGPGIQQIASIYKEKNASIVAFLKEESEPLVDPDQYEVMKTNFAITRTMSDDELKAIEVYMHATLK